MKRILTFIGLIVSMSSLFAQDINHVKMNKDLEVAETILKGLVNNRQSQVFWLSREKQINAEYLEGYGVLITLPIEKNLFQFNLAKVYNRWPEVSDAVNYAIEDLEEENDRIYYIDSDSIINKGFRNQAVDSQQADVFSKKNIVVTQQNFSDYRQRDLEYRQNDIEQRARSFALRTLKSLNTDSVNRANFDKNIENIKLFLLDYGHIISQLKDEDKIKIISRGQNNNNSYYRAENGQIEKANDYNEFSAEIKMKDVRAYQKGKLSKEEAESRIKINNKEEEKPLAKDIAVFKSVMNRLYQSDLSETYYLKSEITSEEIEGLGAILYLDMVSSTKLNQYFVISTQGNQQYNQAERDEKIKALYPKFEEEIVANILEYGKNITSLEENAKLIFKINNTECKGCDIPAQLEIQVKSETLKALKSGTLDENKAKKEVKIIQGRMQ